MATLRREPGRRRSAARVPLLGAPVKQRERAAARRSVGFGKAIASGASNRRGSATRVQIRRRHAADSDPSSVTPHLPAYASTMASKATAEVASRSQSGEPSAFERRDPPHVPPSRGRLGRGHPPPSRRDERRQRFESLFDLRQPALRGPIFRGDVFEPDPRVALHGAAGTISAARVR